MSIQPHGVALPHKSRAPHRPATKVTLRGIASVKEFQENPLLDEFREHAILKRDALITDERGYYTGGHPHWRRGRQQRRLAVRDSLMLLTNDQPHG